MGMVLCGGVVVDVFGKMKKDDGRCVKVSVFGKDVRTGPSVFNIPNALKIEPGLPIRLAL